MTKKLLAVEASQYLTYFASRYRDIEARDAVVYVLNGLGSPDFWPAERYRIAGSKRLDDIVAAAREWHAEERFDGVINFSESAVITAAAVAEALGLEGIGVEAALRSRNKLLMRQAYQAAGAPHPPFRLTPTLGDALAAAAEFGYPVVVKPTLGAGSYCVFRVDGPEELAERYIQAGEGVKHLPWATHEADGIDLGPDGLMVEGFLDGREYLMEALVWDDEVFLGSVVDRVTDEGATFDDDIHHAPTSLPPDELAKVHRAVAAGVHAQGVRRSALHAEVRFHRGEPYLLEIAARVGGGGLDEVARLTAEHDPISAVRDIALGIRPRVRHYQPTDTHIAAMCLICPGGVVRHIEVPPDVSESERVFLLKITARPGDRIRRPPDGNTTFGFLGTTGRSMEDAMQTMYAMAAKITVTLD